MSIHHQVSVIATTGVTGPALRAGTMSASMMLGTLGTRRIAGIHW